MGNTKTYIEITRSDISGSYIQPLEGVFSAIDGELDGIEKDVFVHLKAVVMTQEEYENLPEFTGW